MAVESDSLRTRILALAERQLAEWKSGQQIIEQVIADCRAKSKDPVLGERYAAELEQELAELRASIESMKEAIAELAEQPTSGAH